MQDVDFCGNTPEKNMKNVANLKGTGAKYDLANMWICDLCLCGHLTVAVTLEYNKFSSNKKSQTNSLIK
jgi:hypothetical protein